MSDGDLAVILPAGCTENETRKIFKEKLLLTRKPFRSSLVSGRTLSSEPRRLASLGTLLDDQHWHYVAVELHGLHLNLTVDKHTERLQVPADFHHLDVQQV